MHDRLPLFRRTLILAPATATVPTTPAASAEHGSRSLLRIPFM